MAFMPTNDHLEMILLGRAYQNILFGNLNIFGKYLTHTEATLNVYFAWPKWNKEIVFLFVVFTNLL